MVLATLDTAKGFTKRQVANDVHGKKVHPICYVDKGPRPSVPLGSKLTQLEDQGVSVMLDKRVLCAEGVFSKGVAKQTTDTHMELGVGGGYEVVHFIIRC